MVMSVFGEWAVIYSGVESLIRLDMGLLKEASIVGNFRINYLYTQLYLYEGSLTTQPFTEYNEIGFNEM